MNMNPNMDEPDQLVLYFVGGWGQDMCRQALDRPIGGYKAIAQNRGARVINHFDRKGDELPTHFVLSDTANISNVRNFKAIKNLGFDSVAELEFFLGENGIKCMAIKWVLEGYCPLAGLTPRLKYDSKHLYKHIFPMNADRRSELKANPLLSKELDEE
jgi:hypothetical protein